METYGIGVRAGVLTPIIDDEESFRQILDLPALTQDVADAWRREPVRRPVTLARTAEDGESESDDDETE